MTDQQRPKSGQLSLNKSESDAGAVAPEDRRERRRKDGEAENSGMRLEIPDWVKEKYPRQHFKLAWIANDPSRIHRKHKEDWDPVDGVEHVPGALDTNGNPVNHILHVKRAEWVAEDKAKLETRRREIEQQAEGGKVSGHGNDQGQTLAENVYTETSNRLR